MLEGARKGPAPEVIGRRQSADPDPGIEQYDTAPDPQAGEIPGGDGARADGVIEERTGPGSRRKDRPQARYRNPSITPCFGQRDASLSTRLFSRHRGIAPGEPASTGYAAAG